MADRITIAEAATRLEVTSAFVQRMIDKGRLTPDADGRLEPAEVERFGALLKRLRAGGVATLLGAIDEELGGP